MKKQLLIVEDEKSVFHSLNRMLDPDRYELTWTQTGHEALRRALDETYDLLLLDLNVSDINSSKALSWFCRLHPFLPVILLSDAMGEPPSNDATAILHKPVDRGELVRTIEKLLAESHQEQLSRMAASASGTITLPWM